MTVNADMEKVRKALRNRYSAGRKCPATDALASLDRIQAQLEAALTAEESFRKMLAAAATQRDTAEQREKKLRERLHRAEYAARCDHPDCERGKHDDGFHVFDR